MQKKDIILFSKNTFLKELLEQSHPKHNISHYKKFDSSKAAQHSITILDEISCSESLLDKISNICIVIALESIEKTTHNLVHHLLKPIGYLHLCEIIDTAQQDLMQIDDGIILNISTKTLIKMKGSITCTPITEAELYILQYISSYKDNTKDKILSEALGYNPEIETRTIETHISRLRKKLEPECSIEICKNGRYKFLLKIVE
jgi:hypothetical protein